MLLKFPIHLFKKAITFNTNTSSVLKKIKSLKNPEFPIYISNTKREIPPKFRNDPEKIIWYTSNILQIQKEITDYIDKVEMYYIQIADNLSEVDNELSKI